jgi:HPr kinase/phosphorylase
MTRLVLANVTCVAVAGRGLLIEGAPATGKSSLALALIDRGAVLVGDDGIKLEPRGERVWAHPPPRIGGQLEIRGVGIVEVPTRSAPLCLALLLGEAGERLPEPAARELLGSTVPQLRFLPGSEAVRAEWALRVHGLPLPPDYV